NYRGNTPLLPENIQNLYEATAQAKAAQQAQDDPAANNTADDDLIAETTGADAPTENASTPDVGAATAGGPEGTTVASPTNNDDIPTADSTADDDLTTESEDVATEAPEDDEGPTPADSAA